MSKDIGQLKAQRLMVLGMISEFSEEDQEAVRAAHAAILETVATHEDAGRIAFALAAADLAIKWKEEDDG